MSDTCQECGAKIEGGTAVCHNLLDEFLARSRSSATSGRLSIFHQSGTLLIMYKIAYKTSN